MDKVRIHIEREHSCGQVFEEILHVESADFSFNMDVPPLWSGNLEKGPLKPFTVSGPPVTKLDFTGTCNKLEVTGMDWVSGRGLVCIKCGTDLLFGEDEKGKS